MNHASTAGRLLFAALPGYEIDRDTERALADLGPAGLILFDRNLASPGQLADLVSAAREVCSSPLLVGIDQEGGRVNRMARVHPAFIRLPDARTQGSWPEERLLRAWRAVGAVLRAAGIDVTFAPVVDLDDGDGTNAIGARSFGTDPGRVSAMAARVIAGLRSAGVGSCLKHFPGLGGTDLDTHQALATSPISVAELWTEHVRPYRELAREALFVMTAHAHFPAVDGDDPLPGTFSRRLVSEWLRERVGFEGLVISDDLEMGAVASTGTPGERALHALGAGCDLALFCHSLDAPRRARDTIVGALESGRLSPSSAVASQTRLAVALASLHREPPRPAPVAEALVAATVLEDVLRA